MSKRLLRLACVLGLLAVVAIGTVVLITPTEARGRCICPQVYAPVECDNGRVYANQCLADCRNARNCVPVGLD